MRHALLALLLLPAALLAGCDDNTGIAAPNLFADTVEVYAPTAASAQLPTALDITVSGLGVGGARFPERVADAESWDFTFRVRDGRLVIVPAGALGIPQAAGGLSRAGITHPLDGRTFESVIEAPGSGSFVRDSAVVLERGGVYVARSREQLGFYGACSQFAKVQPLELDPATGRVRLRIVTNANCGDLRLVEEG